MDLVNGGDLIDVEASPLLDRAAHHAESHPHERARNGYLLLLYQLQHELSQLGKWAVHNLPGVQEQDDHYMQYRSVFLELPSQLLEGTAHQQTTKRIIQLAGQGPMHNTGHVSRLMPVKMVTLACTTFVALQYCEDRLQQLRQQKACSVGVKVSRHCAFW